ncbi:uncharacterized protein LOC107468445 [Arachis duranensis]|uniref:Uncharacterized protein LOC107468445 n=1 Tax=Arachis duranensis TaxID=130453 RepID=A0A6P4BUB1_ARADU|nr:uncharacterized protein LOC107468445 [Arachis duranensis]
MDQDVRFYVSLIQDDDNNPVYDSESETLHTPISSDDESSKHKFLEFNDDYEHGEGRFELGTRFATIDRFKEVVKDSFIAEGRELRWIKNDKERVRMGCMDDEWPCLVHLSYNNSLQCYQVKTYKNDHTCARDMGSNAADQHWISLKVEKRMNTQPHMRTSEAIDFLREEFSLTAHPKMVYRAVREARERIMGNEREQYSNVRDYLFEILRSNPGSRGFKSGYRPLIHLDGCFLKTYYGGQLLTVVAQDANNQFYVVAYGVTRSETKESWKWFLTLLEEDLGDVQTHGWNFMSDQQKGLLPALKAVMPNAHHQNCVMYIWKNFINRFKDLYIRKVVWDCAKCTTIPKFKEQMEKLKRINQGAWEYLSKFEPATLVKAYFSHGLKVDNLTNNMCEVFN